jgi:hypothetical protein
MTTLAINPETITIKVKSGRYYKTFNAYKKTYRISKEEAMESIENAKTNGSLFNEMKDWWTYFN